MTEESSKFWIEATPTPGWYVLKAHGEQSPICVANGHLPQLEQLQDSLTSGDLLIQVCPLEMGVRQHYSVGGKLGVVWEEE